jgi:hypothetical protein
MASEVPAVSGKILPTFMQTLGAMVVAPLAWTATAFVVGGAISVSQRIFTVMRPEIIDFFAAMVAAVIGMIAARASCNKLFKLYSRRAIFVEFSLLAGVGLVFELFLLTNPVSPVTTITQLLLITYIAFVLFWQGRD